MPQKKQCEKCKKLYRQRCLRRNKINNQLWCRHCFNKYGEHKLYPNGIVTRENQFVSKYGISEEERKHLFSNLIRQGLSPHQANRRILFNIKMLRILKKKKKWDIQKSKPETNRKFLEGLGQLK